MPNQTLSVPQFSQQDLIGKRFNRLTLQKLVLIEGRRHWVCLCDCGTIKTIKEGPILRSQVKSCGCWRVDLGKRLNRKHGMSRNGPSFHRLYSVWRGMIDRCTRPKAASWKNYGGRGIRVCEQWRDFSVFFKDMSPTWKPGLTLERVNNSLGYCRENCEWKTAEEQSRNTRTSIRVTVGLITKTCVEWSMDLGAPRPTVARRLRSGWAPERAATQPFKPLHRLEVEY